MIGNQKTESDIRELFAKVSGLISDVRGEDGNGGLIQAYNNLNANVLNVQTILENQPPVPVANLLFNGELGHSNNSWFDTSYNTNDESKECAYFYSNDGTMSGIVLDDTRSPTSSTNQTLKNTSHSTYDPSFARWNSSNGWAEMTGVKTVDILLPTNFIDATTPLARVAIDRAAKANRYIELASDCLIFAGIYDNTVGQEKFLTGDLGLQAVANGSAASTVERRYKIFVTTDRGFTILSSEVTVLNAPADGFFTVTDNVSLYWKPTAGYLQVDIYEFVPSTGDYFLVNQVSNGGNNYLHLGSYLPVTVSAYPTATQPDRQAIYYTRNGELANLATNGVSANWSSINFPIGVPNNYDKSVTTGRQWLRIGLTVAPNLYITGCTADGSVTVTAPEAVFDVAYTALYTGLVVEVYDTDGVLILTTSVSAYDTTTTIKLNNAVSAGTVSLRIVGAGFHGVFIDKIHLGYQQNASYAPNPLDNRTLQPVAAPSSSTQGGGNPGGSDGGLGTCVAGTTLIKQADGSLKEIKDAKEGDLWDGAEMLLHLKSAIAPVRRITTENGCSLICTNGERFVADEDDRNGTLLIALKVGQSILTEFGASKITEISPILGQTEVFTPTLGTGHIFIGNGFKLHNRKSPFEEGI